MMMIITLAAVSLLTLRLFFYLSRLFAISYGGRSGSNHSVTTCARQIWPPFSRHDTPFSRQCLSFSQASSRSPADDWKPKPKISQQLAHFRVQSSVTLTDRNSTKTILRPFLKSAALFCPFSLRMSVHFVLIGLAPLPCLSLYVALLCHLGITLVIVHIFFPCKANKAAVITVVSPILTSIENIFFILNCLIVCVNNYSCQITSRRRRT